MKKKTNILITISLLAILALSAIQYYLISNTYMLKKQAFIKEAKKEMKFLESNDAFDDLEDAYMVQFPSSLKQSVFQEFNAEKTLGTFKLFIDSLNIKFNQLYKQELAKKELLYHIDYQKTISEIILVNNLKNDTLLHSTLKDEFTLFGKKLPDGKKFFINNGIWESNSYSKNDDKSNLIPNEDITLIVATKSHISIPNSKSIIFKRMRNLLLLSISSILIVIALFTYAIKSFIQQKKISDIKSDFINNITHELKTPLATLSIASKSLHLDKVQQDKTLFFSTLKTIDRQNSRLQGLIDQVVSDSLGYEEITLQKEKLTDTVLFKNIIEDYAIKNSDVNITQSIDNSTTPLYLDKFHFTTALQNLLDNAIKYGSDIIELKTIKKNTTYTIIIEDNGIGIPKQEQELVFDKFYRVKSGDLHDTKGLGLGLYYVKQIVKAHLGKIHLDSEEQKGTKITITLPIQ